MAPQAVTHHASGAKARNLIPAIGAPQHLMVVVVIVRVMILAAVDAGLAPMLDEDFKVVKIHDTVAIEIAGYGLIHGFCKRQNKIGRALIYPTGIVSRDDYRDLFVLFIEPEIETHMLVHTPGVFFSKPFLTQKVNVAVIFERGCIIRQQGEKIILVKVITNALSPNINIPVRHSIGIDAIEIPGSLRTLMGRTKSIW